MSAKQFRSSFCCYSEVNVTWNRCRARLHRSRVDVARGGRRGFAIMKRFSDSELNIVHRGIHQLIADLTPMVYSRQASVPSDAGLALERERRGVAAETFERLLKEVLRIITIAPPTLCSHCSVQALVCRTCKQVCKGSTSPKLCPLSRCNHVSCSKCKKSCRCKSL